MTDRRRPTDETSDGIPGAQLHAAAFALSVSRIRDLLAESPNPDVRDEKGATALLTAAKTVALSPSRRAAQREIVAMLLDAGADLEARDALGCTPLHRAVSAGQVELVDQLLDAGADLEARDDEGASALVRAAAWSTRRTGVPEVFSHLLTRGPELDAADGEGRTALHHLCSAARMARREPAMLSMTLRLTKQLLEAGANPNPVDDAGGTPLLKAIRRKSPAMVRLLVEAGAELTPHQGEYSRLFSAVNIGAAEIVGVLLAAGADVNRVEPNGRTALHLAASDGNAEIIAKLVEGGADLEKRDKEGRTPLQLAAQSGELAAVRQLASAGGHPENVDLAQLLPNETLCDAIILRDVARVRALIEAGVDVNAEDENGVSPLWLAVRLGQGGEGMVALILGAGASLETPEGELSYLRQAVEQDSPELVRMLIGAGADPSEPCGHGTTPLFEATPEAMEVLVEHGAQVDVADEDGDTPLHLWAYRGDPARLRRLARLGADLEARNNMGWTPLLQAIRFGNEGSAATLLELGADVNAPGDDDHETPLHVACRVDTLHPMVSLLMQAGADVNAQRHDGKTPLMLACGNSDLVRRLLAAGADPNLTDCDGRPSLHSAMTEDDGESVRALLAAGADPARASWFGVPLFTLALIGGHTETVRALIEEGAAPEGPGALVPALVKAARVGHVEMLEVLLALGDFTTADIELAITDAEGAGHGEAAAYLRRAARD